MTVVNWSKLLFYFNIFLINHTYPNKHIDRFCCRSINIFQNLYLQWRNSRPKMECLTIVWIFYYVSHHLLKPVLNFDNRHSILSSFLLFYLISLLSSCPINYIKFETFNIQYLIIRKRFWEYEQLIGQINNKIIFKCHFRKSTTLFEINPTFNAS